MSKQTQLAPVNTQAVVGNFTQAELDTLKATIARGTTNEQFALFVQTCVNSGLNPFLNHIHCIVYNGKEGPTMSIQIAVEGILYLSRRTEGYKGIECQLVHENDEFKFNAKTKEITHEIGFPRGKVVGGYAIAKREGFDDVIVIMEVNEVEHMLKGRNAHMWREWFNDMFKKHLIKRAAKLQYGIEIAEDEPVSGNTLDTTASYEPRQRIDITPDVGRIEVNEGEVVDMAAELKKKQDEIKQQMQRYNMTTNDLNQLTAKHFNNKKPNELTLQQLVALSKFIDMEHQNRQSSAQKQETFDPENLQFSFDEFEQESFDIE
jgi:recombination protein RecT